MRGRVLDGQRVTYERLFRGLSVGVKAGADEAATTPSARRLISFGFSYGDEPMYFANHHESHNNVFSTQGAGGDAKWHQAKANYDFGAAKLVTGVGSGKDNTGTDQRLGAGRVVPAGHRKPLPRSIGAKGRAQQWFYKLALGINTLCQANYAVHHIDAGRKIGHQIRIRHWSAPHILKSGGLA